ncbi:CPBP family intramembrane glutamic endopeptidase [Paenibacillus allorhizosphaerae]|uniref:CPBP family intramembrane glutamic endopeptidase n=1 Tax=Paenibacillus allorhizosphaerae TaxID=2849866 RepID=UPI003616C3D5
MTRKELFILIAFFVFIGPRPSDFYLLNNKYFIGLAPIIVISLIGYCMREDIILTDYNKILKSRQNVMAYFNCFQFSIYAQAATSIIFGTSVGAYDGILDSFAIMPVYAVIIAPIAEEIVYRKIIFSFLSKFMNFWIASSISSTIFALGHFNLNRFIGYFITGMIFCYFYKKSQSILPMMAAHSSINFISLLVTTLRG